MRHILLSAALLGFASFVVGCSSSSDATTTDAATDSAGHGCYYGGVSYGVGVTFKSTDGCNTCICAVGGLISCTTMACLDGGLDVGGDVGGCTYGGRTYSVGDKFPATDDCNTCVCNAGGAVACTKCACIPLDGGSDGGDVGDGGDASAEAGPRCGA